MMEEILTGQEPEVAVWPSFAPLWALVYLDGHESDPDYCARVKDEVRYLSEAYRTLYFVFELACLEHLDVDLIALWCELREKVGVKGLVILVGVTDGHKQHLKSVLRERAARTFWVVDDLEEASRLIRRHFVAEVNQLVFPNEPPPPAIPW